MDDQVMQTQDHPTQDGPAADGAAGTGGAGAGPSRRGFFTGAVAAGAAALGAGAVATRQSAQAATAVPRDSGLPTGVAPAAPVGFVLSHEQFRTPDLVQWAGMAERAGFGHVWSSDHFQPWQDDQANSMFPWNTLSLVAGDTFRIELGTGVTCPTYRHHPTQVAQAFASLGILAPGRVFLGVGTGEALNEMAATGQFGPYAERAERLVEAVTLIRALWTGERTTFNGKYYRTVSAKLYDLPPQAVPIYMAASGPKSAYNAGRHGDGWIAAVKDLMDPQLVDAFNRGAADAGKDPATMPKYVETFVTVGDVQTAQAAAELWRFTADSWNPALLYEPNPVEIQRKAEAMFPLEEVYGSWTVSTDPQVHIDALQKVLDAGGTPFVHSGQPDQAAVIDFYGRYVLPRVHRP